MTGSPVRNTHPNNPWDWYISPTWKTHKNQPKNVGKYTVRPMDRFEISGCSKELKGKLAPMADSAGTLRCPRPAAIFETENSSPNWPTTFWWKTTLTTLVVSVFLCWRTYMFSLLKMLSSWKRSSRKRSPNWLFFSFWSIETVISSIRWFVRVWQGARTTYRNEIHIYIYII